MIWIRVFVKSHSRSQPSNVKVIFSGGKGEGVELFEKGSG
jgi:hypothetical protein